MSRRYFTLGYTRDSFATRAGAICVRAKRAPAVAYLFQNTADKPAAAGFFGKADKPAFHHHFRDEAARARFLEIWFQQQEELTQRRAAQHKQRVAFRHTLKLGDVLSNSWGYDQTNTEFYEVTKLIGDTMCELRELACQAQQDGFLSESIVPMPGRYLDKAPLRRRIQEGNSVNIYGHGFGWARLYHRREPGKIDLMPPKHVSHTH